VETLQAATRDAMASKSVQEALNPLGFVSQGTDSAIARDTLTGEIERTARLVKAAGITPQ